MLEKLEIKNKDLIVIGYDTGAGIALKMATHLVKYKLNNRTTKIHISSHNRIPIRLMLIRVTQTKIIK